MIINPSIKIVVADDSSTMRIMFKQILNTARFKNLDKIQRYMHNIMEIGKIIDIEKFIESRFADKAYQ